MSFLDIDVDEIEALLQEPEADHAEWEGCEEVVKAGHRLSDVWYKCVSPSTQNQRELYSSNPSEGFGRRSKALMTLIRYGTTFVKVGPSKDRLCISARSS